MSDRLALAVAELVDALCEEFQVVADHKVPDQLLAVSEAARRLGISRTSLYNEIQAGRLRSVKAGRRRLVPSSAVDSYIDTA